MQTRLKRQRILTSEQPKTLVSVLDESVLLRQLSSPRVMRDQLAQLIAVSQRENVTLRVLPLGGAHPIGTGAFILLRFAPIPESLGPAESRDLIAQVMHDRWSE